MHRRTSERAIRTAQVLADVSSKSEETRARAVRVAASYASRRAAREPRIRPPPNARRQWTTSSWVVLRRYFTERTAELCGEAWHAFANELNTRISELVSSSAPHEQVGGAAVADCIAPP